MDPAEVFRAANLDIARFHEVPPAAIPVVPFDARRAWAGPHPSLDFLITVELATWQGRVTSFHVRWPWKEPASAETQAAWDPFTLFSTLFLLVLLFCIFFFAWRNLRLGRGDRRGGLRFVAAAFAATLPSCGLFRLRVDVVGIRCD